jgi:O-methyltransferase
MESLEKTASMRARRAEKSWLRSAYLRFVLPRVADPLIRQRLKLVYYGWGYLRLLRVSDLSLRERLRFLRRFLRIDWNVLHCHLPAEISEICCVLAERPARPGEVVVEAGCWQGGSSAKLSVLCKFFGYELHIFDSFQGVETLPPEEQAEEWDFAGQYASPETRLRDNLERHGEPSSCSIHPGWFSETLARCPVPAPVRLAYIDCDLAKGTFQVLQGVLPSLVEDGVVFSQDFHIDPVRRLLLAPETWRRLGVTQPTITPHGVFLASLRFGAG